MDAIVIAAVVLGSGLPFIALGLKWELGWSGILQRLPLFIIINLVICHLLGWEWLPSLLVSCLLLGVEVPASILPFFYRNPERTPPSNPLALVSPADGHVVYVKRISNGSIPLCEKQGREFTPEELSGVKGLTREGYLVGIGMTFLDVHVTRAPIDGEVSLYRHVPGKFISLKLPEAVIRNERATIVFENGDLTVATVLIASRLVRRIVSYVSAGQSMKRGERTGMIKLGSQVDVIIPLEAVEDIMVEVGDQLQAGESVIAILKSSQEGRS
ncbi:MAG: phosphatidylserine decarboxylase [Sphaerochaetaceae bacterium]|nr:phosphatidylserine decarboxylase [Sphaerochaetaceae bacterium]